MFSFDEGLQDGDPLPELFSSERWRELRAILVLTKRQTEVARRICLGMTNSEIAGELRVSESVVRSHTDALYKRLNVNRRVGVVVRIVVAGRCKRCAAAAGE
ncbi:MAG: response regulator transcription factor [Planctomycetes bacterium]|nr:response regulator transcription factor [Planctomycetota bacterium]MBI3833440.1 response regulator transcription factor [Planctomycetota bacterium]